ncbi:S-adenosylmethionine decarboxylase family protein [Roseimaritima sediminicola]|uniref:S-adenosylmethionine decarboxylase family protein n=1 Tax=Roseimaritima sediminicola TaxID=2662066 RepID=UPI0012982C0D|nr:S-adenosylmethionine decarboxylase [Roseimaritima sediminicola]
MTQPRVSAAASPLPSSRVPATGTEWIIDAGGCDPGSLCNLDLLRALCDQVIEDLGLVVVGTPQAHAFAGPGGVTAMYLLTESHLTVHTYPEYGTATFNLYCCRSRPEWPWGARLAALLDADQVVVRSLVRGCTMTDPAVAVADAPHVDPAGADGS